MVCKVIIALLLTVAYTNAGAVDFKRCQGIETTGIVSNVIIPSCTSLPCVFLKGGSYSIEIDFENYKETETLTTEVYGNVAGVNFAWPGLDSDGCKFMLVGQCPFRRNDYVTFGMSMKVEELYPSVEAQLRWLIKGDDGRAIFCWEIPVLLR